MLGFEGFWLEACRGLKKPKPQKGMLSDHRGRKFTSLVAFKLLVEMSFNKGFVFQSLQTSSAMLFSLSMFLQGSLLLTLLLCVAFFRSLELAVAVFR